MSDAGRTRTRTPARSWLSLAVIMTVVVGGSQTVAWWQARDMGDKARELAQTGDIVMYTTSTCPYCAKAKAWLNANHVVWQECNVDTSAACQHQFQARGAPGTPLMAVQGQWQLGFDAQWVVNALQTPKPSSEASPRP